MLLSYLIIIQKAFSQLLSSVVVAKIADSLAEIRIEKMFTKLVFEFVIFLKDTPHWKLW
jgi:hypothetical protein